MKFKLTPEEIKYAKIEYKDTENDLCIKKLIIKTINNREIVGYSKFENISDTPTPQNVILNFICNDGLYKTNTVLKSISKDHPYLVFALQTPENADLEQNREFFRIKVSYNCIYKIKEAGEIKDYLTQTVDLSANGVSLSLPTLDCAQNIFEIVLDIENRKIPLRVHYIRAEKQEHDYRVSYTFTKLSEQDRDYISQTCIKKQLEQRRNSIK